MEGLLAIDLARNIFNLLQVAAKVSKKTVRAYKSKSGLLEEDEDLRADAERLQSLAGLVEQENHTLADQNPNISTILCAIAKDCGANATALINALDDLRAPTEPSRVLDGLRFLATRGYKADRILKIEAKFRSLEKSLALHLTATSSVQQSTIHGIVRNLQQHNGDLEASTTAKLDEIQSLLQNTQWFVDKEKKNHLVQDAVTKLVSYLDQFQAEARRVKLKQDVLQSLLFQKIRQRHDAIQERHKATFDWIFTQQEESSFCEWLESENEFFWVKGKAGSGKSTLMKYLAGHSTTQSKLQTWGAGRQVITASHFFWNAGSQMQKSLAGLLQTLLYQVLKECPELIQEVCKSRVQSPSSAFSEPWDEKELLSAFEELSRQDSLPLKFCFFIDGLDEYTAGEKSYSGTFDELLKPLRALASSGSIKICVSSRPWNPFNTAFGQEQWKLQLEDLTRGDIQKYVKEELGSDARFEELSKADNRCIEIPDIIVERAQGVFLWVYLVVNSLKRGLSNDDNYSDLQKRLDELPANLQEYFKHMLRSIETIYWDQASRIFRIVICAGQSIPLVGFEYLDQEMTDPNYAISMRSQPFPPDEIDPTCQKLKARLNARCRDLLYVKEHPKELDIARHQVDFLHRTVRDFFLDTGVLGDMLKQRPTEKFDPHLSLCRIMLALSKRMPIDDSSSRVYNQLFLFADSLMHYAWEIEHSQVNVDRNQPDKSEGDGLAESFKILDELDKSNSERLKSLGFHWMNIKDTPKGLFQEYQQKTFLAGAIQAGLSSYVEERLRQDTAQLRQKRGRPLLDYALRPAMVTPLAIANTDQGPVLEIVKLLLELRADPNAGIYVYDGRTPWELFLRTCFQSLDRGLGSEDVAKDIGVTIQLMIHGGANVNCPIKMEDGSEVDIIDIPAKLGLSSHQTEQIRQLVKGKLNTGSLFSWITRWVS